ncbi:cytochrome c oxidase subunit 3 [Halomonas stenophila]|uniref:Cytochrome c oxidase subunit 3 n=1 Tax=Halomonas stenophila TaxID=795312 RepID=A0A7W5ETV9_9GAMM|nr:cytochrome c oxidase subunit 3 [Halomonas stenophila]MBB3230947.1 cytochrome c oxidase subunit 3 [Halomonas stenophila]
MPTTPPPTESGRVADQFDDIDQQREANLFGMWLFLATELLLFGGVFAGFVVFRVIHGEAFAEAAGHLDLALGTLNTALLLTSGLTMALAEQLVNAARRRAALAMLLATLALGAAFLAIKAYEWHHEYMERLMPVLGLPFEYPGKHPQQAELFFNFYFALTGLHAFHMLVGLCILGVLAILTWRWRDPPRIARQVQISGLYWAFVDVLWVVVFTLLYLLRL